MGALLSLILYKSLWKSVTEKHFTFQEIPDPDDEPLNKKEDGLPKQCLEKTPSCPMKKHVS